MLDDTKKEIIVKKEEELDTYDEKASVILAKGVKRRGSKGVIISKHKQAKLVKGLLGK